MNNSIPHVVLILLICLYAAISQNSDPYEIHFDHLTIEDGLSQNTIYSIIQDDIGFMWFGTGDGLNRYDGTEFKVYKRDPRNPNNLSANSVRALLQDGEGILWIGTSRGGLNRFDVHQNQFTHFKYSQNDSQSISNDYVRHIFEDSQGRLWVGTYSGLNLLDRSTGKFRRFLHDPEDVSSLSHNFIFFINEDSSGNIWIGTDNGLNRFNPENASFQRHFISPEKGDPVLSNIICTILPKSAHELWLGTGRGLITFDIKTEQFGSYLFDILRLYNEESYLGMRKIIASDDGKLWLASERHGLFHFDPATGEYTHYHENPNNPTSLSDYKILNLYEDRSGGFWIGTVEGGINKIIRSRKKFQHYHLGRESVYRLNDNMVMSVFEDRHGILWIGTWNGGLNRLDREKGEVTYYMPDPANPNSLATTDVRDILEDSYGNFWVGTEGGGLHLMDRKTGTFKRYQVNPGDSTALQDNDVWHIYQDRQNRLWLGTYGGGLSLYHQETDNFTTFLPDENDTTSIKSAVIVPIYEDSRNMFWLGTDKGLHLMDRETNTFKNFMYSSADSQSISANSIISILEDRNGNMWFGTHGGGLNKLDASQIENAADFQFTFYTEDDGLPNNVVYGLVEDEWGKIWVSTNSGLACFDPVSEIFRNFDISDGLQNNEFNSGAYFKNAHGEIFFGGISGLTAFDPQEIQQNNYKPPVVLTSIKKYNREIKIDSNYADLKKITLNYDDDVVSFEFAGLSYIATDKNSYRYMLDGFDQDWIFLGNKHDVTFTDLDPGVYNLRVRAANNDGVWNEQGLNLQINVLAPFWQTWWFYLITGIIIIGLLWSGYLFRTRTIMRRNQELEREVQARLKAERELQKLNMELEDRVKRRTSQLESSNKELESFSYSVSHDLRAPLRSISGFSHILLEDFARSMSAEANGYLTRITDAIKQMDGIVNGLLNLYRLTKSEMQISEVHLSEEVQKVFAALQEQIDQKIELKIEPNLVVHCDQRLIRIVLQNLLDNACKYRKPGGKHVVEFGRKNIRNGTYFYVADNGVGFDMKYQEKLFVSFQRFHDGNQYPGLGIGLATVHKIISRHNGHVFAESRSEKGATFYFSVNLAPMST